MFFVKGISQSPDTKFSGRFLPAITKERIGSAKFVHEIMPEFRRFVILPYHDHFVLMQQLDLFKYNQENYFYPQENYSDIINYVFVEITAVCNGKTLKSKSTNNLLTAEQNNILCNADLGSDIHIKFNFNYKNRDIAPGENKIIEGEYNVTIIPEIEAEFPGGFNQITPYLIKSVSSKTSNTNFLKKINTAIVKFTVNESGKITDAKITRSSSDPELDKVLIEVINNMPKWKPAKNAKGIAVKQVFAIPLGGNGGC